jgi:hypothetical protein
MADDAKIRDFNERPKTMLEMSVQREADDLLRAAASSSKYENVLQEKNMILPEVIHA